MAGLDIQGLTKRYLIKNRSVHAICDIDLVIGDGEFVAVVGKSGCGKTTLLRLLCGLEKANEGSIRLPHHNTNRESDGRRISIVFQEPRLMPWLTVRQNMAFALHREKDRQEVNSTVDNFLDMLGLTEFQHAYPKQISGGMAQRTALGRTLCFNPDIILMDEPFGALDAFTRRKLQQELVEIFHAQHKTIVFVTHDVDEAVLLGQRVLVMEGGCIVCDLANKLPYPRDALTPDFISMREQIFRTILT